MTIDDGRWTMDEKRERKWAKGLFVLIKNIVNETSNRQVRRDNENIAKKPPLPPKIISPATISQPTVSFLIRK